MKLHDVKDPSQLSALSFSELEDLAQQIREALLTKTSQVGGHLAPNLGVVELTLALHRTFSSPADKLVFDVSHQTYPHKMLTGRAEAFLDPAHFGNVSGFTSPLESDHDQFTIGHTSTSVALALGLAKARDLLEKNYHVVAVIGDGSLSGGEAFEGLDAAGEYRGNLIIIVNDNDFSIAENHGGIYANLAELRRTKGEARENYFRALGLDYRYVEDGHDLQVLCQALEAVRDTERPVVLHIHTVKGKGYPPAEKNPELFHSTGPFDRATGKTLAADAQTDAATLFGADTERILKGAIEKDNHVVGITAGTPSMMGFWKPERDKAGSHFIDVGIAEPAAVSLAAGLAKGGAQPLFVVRSSFVQRAYDQIAQDVCIDSLPVTFVIFTGSLYAMHDITHQGLSDIPLLSSIPNLTYLCPTSTAEYEAMLTWSLSQRDLPVAIKLPGIYQEGVRTAAPSAASAAAPSAVSAASTAAEKPPAEAIPIAGAEKSAAAKTPFSIYQIVREGSKVALLGLGTFLPLAEETANLLKEKCGIDATVVNPRFCSGVDEARLQRLAVNHELIVTLEDGRAEGGFGDKVAAFYGTDSVKVLVRGVSQELMRKYSVEGLLEKNGLTAPQLVAEIQQLL